MPNLRVFTAGFIAHKLGVEAAKKLQLVPMNAEEVVDDANLHEITSFPGEDIEKMGIAVMSAMLAVAASRGLTGERAIGKAMPSGGNKMPEEVQFKPEEEIVVIFYGRGLSFYKTKVPG